MSVAPEAADGSARGVGVEAVERGYRRALLAYPRRWRARNGEQLLGVLLDMAEDPERHGTSGYRREVVSVVGHGLAVRLSPLGIAFPTGLRARLSTLAVASGAALSLLFLLTVDAHRIDVPGSGAPSYLPAPLSVMTPVYAGWLLLLVFSALRRPRPVRVTALLTAVYTAAVPGIAAATGAGRPLLHQLAVLGALALWAATASSWTRPPHPAVMLTLTAAVLAACLIAARMFHGTGPGLAQDYPTATLNLADLSRGIGLVTLVAAAVLAVTPLSGWTAPVLITAVPWAGFGVWEATTSANSVNGPTQLLLRLALGTGVAITVIHTAMTGTRTARLAHDSRDRPETGGHADHGHGRPRRCPGEVQWAGVHDTGGD